MQLPGGQSSFTQKIYSLKLSTFWGRRLIFIGIFVCMLLYYVVPNLYRHVLSGFSYGNSAQACMDRHLLQCADAVSTFDTVVHRDSQPDDESISSRIPFVGNGKLGSIVDYQNPSFYMFYDVPTETKDGKKIKAQQILKLPLDILIRPEYISGSMQSDESTVLNFRRGIVEKLSSFSLPSTSGGCLFVNHTLVAHRSRPHLFLQHIEAKIESKKSRDLLEEIYLNQESMSSNKVFKPLQVKQSKRYKLYGASVEIQGKSHMAVVVAQTDVPRSLHVRESSVHIDSIAVIMHSDIMQDSKSSQAQIPSLRDNVLSYMDSILLQSTDNLLQEHKNAWSDILHTGLSISTSKELDPEIPTPLTINSTLYYVLSTMDSKLHDEGIPQKERYDLMKRLETPDFCYNGNPTAHAQTLWHSIASIEDAAHLGRLWSLTLRTSGCQSLISEGAEGMLQAMVLSFGGLQFTEFYLKLQTNPDILHNQIAFHSVMYKNNTVDISIRDLHGSPTIEVVLVQESQSVPLYACEAGCMSPVLRLNKQARFLPVYVTEPRTPILYISHDKKHLEDLKHTMHVRKIVDHAEHMESKKKGGLPAIFWFSIGSLIILFHLFLVRMIFKEYYSSSGPSATNKTYYSNRGRLAS